MAALYLLYGHILVKFFRRKRRLERMRLLQVKSDNAGRASDIERARSHSCVSEGGGTGSGHGQAEDEEQQQEAGGAGRRS